MTGATWRSHHVSSVQTPVKLMRREAGDYSGTAFGDGGAREGFNFMPSSRLSFSSTRRLSEVPFSIASRFCLLPFPTRYAMGQPNVSILTRRINRDSKRYKESCSGPVGEVQEARGGEAVTSTENARITCSGCCRTNLLPDSVLQLGGHAARLTSRSSSPML